MKFEGDMDRADRIIREIRGAKVQEATFKLAEELHQMRLDVFQMIVEEAKDCNPAIHECFKKMHAQFANIKYCQ